MTSFAQTMSLLKSLWVGGNMALVKSTCIRESNTFFWHFFFILITVWYKDQQIWVAGQSLSHSWQCEADALALSKESKIGVLDSEKTRTRGNGEPQHHQSQGHSPCRDQGWTALSTPGRSDQHPLWRLLVWGGSGEYFSFPSVFHCKCSVCLQDVLPGSLEATCSHHF